MKIIACTQGSDTWRKLRAGVITASRFRDAVDTLRDGKTPSSKSLAYAANLAIERVSGEPCEDTFVTWQMRRGTELEPEARLEYEAKTGNVVLESGIFLTEDNKFGSSLDGLVPPDGSVEIKCPSSAERIIAMWRDGDLSEYIHQIQGGLWITGRKWCDFVMYAPQLAAVGKQLYVKRVERDEAFIETLEAGLMKFAARVDDLEQVLRQRAA